MVRAGAFAVFMGAMALAACSPPAVDEFGVSADYLAELDPVESDWQSVGSFEAKRHLFAPEKHLVFAQENLEPETGPRFRFLVFQGGRPEFVAAVDRGDHRRSDMLLLTAYQGETKTDLVAYTCRPSYQRIKQDLTRRIVEHTVSGGVEIIDDCPVLSLLAD